jgi:hypothetical protein
MPKQIGWSNESNLLYTISSQISRLAGIIATSGGGGGGTITGGGAAGQVTFWNGATSITGSNNLFWDAAQNRLGIGTNTPTDRITISTNVNAGSGIRVNNTSSGNNQRAQISLFNDIGTNGSLSVWGSNTGLANKTLFTASKDFIIGTDADVPNGGTSKLQFFVAGYNFAQNPQLTLHATGNLSLGSTTDNNTNRLQVTGTSLFTGATTIVGQTIVTGTDTLGATNAFVVRNSALTNSFVVTNAGDCTIRASLTATGGNVIVNNILSGVNQNLTISAPYAGNNVVTIQAWPGSDRQVLINSTGNIVRTSGTNTILNVTEAFIPPSGNAISNLILVNPTIDQTSGANGITRGLYIQPTLTNPANWRSIEWSNNTGWGLYGSGTAPNYLGGDLTIAGKLALTVVTNRQTANYSLVLADNGKLVETNVGAANTITVPPNSSITFPIGTKIDIAQYGAGQTTIVPGIGVTVRSAGGALKLSAQYSGATIVKIGTDEWYLFGDITV